MPSQDDRRYFRLYIVIVGSARGSTHLRVSVLASHCNATSTNDEPASRTVACVALSLIPIYCVGFYSAAKAKGGGVAAANGVVLCRIAPAAF